VIGLASGRRLLWLDYGKFWPQPFQVKLRGTLQRAEKAGVI